MGSKKNSANKRQEKSKGQANGGHSKSSCSQSQDGNSQTSAPLLKGKDKQGRSAKPGPHSASSSPPSSPPPASRVPWRVIMLVGIMAGGVAILCRNEQAKTVMGDVYLRHVQPQALRASQSLSSGLAAVRRLVQGDSASSSPRSREDQEAKLSDTESKPVESPSSGGAGRHAPDSTLQPTTMTTTTLPPPETKSEKTSQGEENRKEAAEPEKPVHQSEKRTHSDEPKTKKEEKPDSPVKEEHKTLPKETEESAADTAKSSTVTGDQLVPGDEAAPDASIHQEVPVQPVVEEIRVKRTPKAGTDVPAKKSEKQTKSPSQEPQKTDTKQAEKASEKLPPKSEKSAKEDEKPAEKRDTQPAEKSTQKPTEKDEKPDPKSQEKPSSKPTEKSDGKPSEKADQKPTEKEEKHAQSSQETPASQPTEKSGVKSNEKTNQEPAENDEKAVPKSQEKPASKPAEKLDEKPAEKSAPESTEEDEKPLKSQGKAASKPTGTSQGKASEESDEKQQRKAEEKSASGSTDSKPAAQKTSDTSGSASKKNDYAKAAITNKADFKIRDKLDEAEELLQQGRYEDALSKYDGILRKHPKSPRAQLGRADALDVMASKRRSNEILEQSIMGYERLLYHGEDVLPELMKLTGRQLAKKQQFRGWGTRAAKTFQFLVERFPEDLSLLREQGVSHLMVGQNQEARKVFQHMLELNPDDGFAQVHLGFIVKTTDNNPQGALGLLQSGIDSEQEGTQDGRFYFHLGDAFQRLGRVEEARGVYQRGAQRGLFLSADQRSLYNVDRLKSRPWWTKEQTGYQQFLKLLEDNWRVIRDEGLRQLDAKSGFFKPEAESLREKGDWKQLTMYQQGRQNKKVCEMVPKTCALVEQIPEAKGCKRGQVVVTAGGRRGGPGMPGRHRHPSSLPAVAPTSFLTASSGHDGGQNGFKLVKFSVMQPGVHVWPHCGPTNCRLRAHLGLVVPQGPRIRVVNETRHKPAPQFIQFCAQTFKDFCVTWKEGKFIIFDDSFEHEVWHDGSSLRLVLIVDFWHPDLTEAEKRSLMPI